MDEPMTIEVVRSGGFAGRVVRWEVCLDRVPPDTASELSGLVQQAPSWQADGGGGDRFQWRVHTSTSVDVAFPDPAPEPARRLIALVREQATPA